MRFVDEFALSVGLAPDTLKTGVILFGNFPLCLLYNRLPGKFKDVFSILVSSLSFTILFEPAGFAQIAGLALLCYTLTKFLRFYAWGPVAIFLIAMGTLSAK
jgi:hypothetical protein